MAYQKVNAIFSSPETQGARHRRHLLHLRQRSLQGLRGLRHGLRRSHGAARWCRRPRKSTPSTRPAPRSSTCCPTRRRSTSASSTRPTRPDSKTATLRNMLMVRRNYDALVSGDGACAGCGEKSVLRSIAAVTEAYMRPVFHAKADRFVAQGRRAREERRRQKLAALKAANPEEYATAAPGDRAPHPGPRRRGRLKTPSRASPRTKKRTARSPTRSWSKRSPRFCSPRRSTTRACSPSTGAWPTA